MNTLSKEALRILEQFVKNTDNHLEDNCIGNAFLNNEDRCLYNKILEELKQYGFIEKTDNGIWKVSESGFQYIERLLIRR